MLTNILVPTDGSTLSAKAVNAAIELAKLTNAGLVALHVYPRYPGSPYGTFESAGEALEQAYERQAKANADQLFADIRQKTEAEGLQFESALVESNAVWEQVIAVARRKKCDLVCMASHGRRGVGALVLGSETQKVLTHSTLPVLVVR
jgi:nucleotide-binding universal stress UspA family protein